VLQRKTVKLNRSCRFRVSFRVRRKAVGTAKQLTVIQRFHRNRALDPRTDRFTVRVPEISTAARKSA
jgi:hypothetical protein